MLDWTIFTLLAQLPSLVEMLTGSECQNSKGGKELGAILAQEAAGLTQRKQRRQGAATPICLEHHVKVHVL